MGKNSKTRITAVPLLCNYTTAAAVAILLGITYQARTSIVPG